MRVPHSCTSGAWTLMTGERVCEGVDWTTRTLTSLPFCYLSLSSQLYMFLHTKGKRWKSGSSSQTFFSTFSPPKYQAPDYTVFPAIGVTSCRNKGKLLRLHFSQKRYDAIWKSISAKKTSPKQKSKLKKRFDCLLQFPLSRLLAADCLALILMFSLLMWETNKTCGKWKKNCWHFLFLSFFWVQTDFSKYLFIVSLH